MRKRIDVLILLIVLVGGFFAVSNAAAIGDWLYFLSYDPPSEIERIAEDAGMNERGKKLFYRFSPELVSQSKLDALCDSDKLGCVEGQSLYILDHSSEAEYKRSIVTASHEMLHVAWSRLSSEEIEELEPLLEREVAKPGASKVSEQIEGFSGMDKTNEAHSYVGSELDNISTELEEHYEQYFSDRSKSTQANAFSAN